MLITSGGNQLRLLPMKLKTYRVLKILKKDKVHNPSSVLIEESSVVTSDDSLEMHFIAARDYHRSLRQALFILIGTHP